MISCLLTLFWSPAPFRSTGHLPATYPACAIGDKVRQAVRAHQLRCGTLGEFVDEHMSQVVMFYIPPILFLTMGSIAALMRLDRVAIGAEPELSEELDDDEADAVREEWSDARHAVRTWSFVTLI